MSKSTLSDFVVFSAECFSIHLLTLSTLYTAVMIPSSAGAIYSPSFNNVLIKYLLKGHDPFVLLNLSSGFLIGPM